MGEYLIFSKNIGNITAMSDNGDKRKGNKIRYIYVLMLEFSDIDLLRK